MVGVCGSWEVGGRRGCIGGARNGWWAFDQNDEKKRACGEWMKKRLEEEKSEKVFQ